MRMQSATVGGTVVPAAAVVVATRCLDSLRRFFRRLGMVNGYGDGDGCGCWVDSGCDSGSDAELRAGSDSDNAGSGECINGEYCVGAAVTGMALDRNLATQKTAIPLPFNRVDRAPGHGSYTSTRYKAAMTVSISDEAVGRFSD